MTTEKIFAYLHVCICLKIYKIIFHVLFGIIFCKYFYPLVPSRCGIFILQEIKVCEKVLEQYYVNYAHHLQNYIHTHTHIHKLENMYIMHANGILRSFRHAWFVIIALDILLSFLFI